MPNRSPNFEESFAIATQALRYIGRYRLPPTPQIYEVWYRFAEGQDETIKSQLSHAIERSDAVSKQLIEDLYQQFCRADVCDQNQSFSQRLETEMQGLQTVIDTQIEAGEAFGQSMDSVNESLTAPDMTPPQAQDCITDLLTSNAAMQTQLDEMKERLQESKQQIDLLKRDLYESQKTMLTDPLTGVGNRRAFEALMDAAIRDRDALGTQLAALVLVDLDGFKAVNDTLGHSVGDSLLQFIARSIESLREDASVARYGGDEFGAFVKVQTAAEGLEFAEQVRNALATHRFEHKMSGTAIGRVTTSVGLAILREDDTHDSWFDRADKLLMRAKEADGNCVRAERQISC
ncbi:GGDEF domain-containing protein [Roseimaritima ulvae]|nr:diguanylate cyclase [Roseimaritima ulvae]